MSAIDKWFFDPSGAGKLQTEAVRRETENELERAKRQKLDTPKDYEKQQKVQAAKTARLRELRLAKEAQERTDAAVQEVVAPKPRARRKAVGG